MIIMYIYITHSCDHNNDTEHNYVRQRKSKSKLRICCIKSIKIKLTFYTHTYKQFLYIFINNFKLNKARPSLTPLGIFLAVFCQLLYLFNLCLRCYYILIFSFINIQQQHA